MNGLVKLSYSILFDLPLHTLGFTKKVILGSDIFSGLL